MSEPRDDMLADIRGELWSVYASLKAGAIDEELGGVMISALDSLLDAARLERELEDGDAQRNRARWPMRRR